MLIKKSTTSRHRVQNTDTRLSSLREVFALKVPLGEINRLHGIDTFDLNKELVSSMNLNLAPYDLLLVTTTLLRDDKKLKRKRGNSKGLRIIF